METPIIEKLVPDTRYYCRGRPKRGPLTSWRFIGRLPHKTFTIIDTEGVDLYPLIDNPVKGSYGYVITTFASMTFVNNKCVDYVVRRISHNHSYIPMTKKQLTIEEKEKYKAIIGRNWATIHFINKNFTTDKSYTYKSLRNAKSRDAWNYSKLQSYLNYLFSVGPVYAKGAERENRVRSGIGIANNINNRRIACKNREVVAFLRNSKVETVKELAGYVPPFRPARLQNHNAINELTYFATFLNLDLGFNVSWKLEDFGPLTKNEDREGKQKTYYLNEAI